MVINISTCVLILGNNPYGDCVPKKTANITLKKVPLKSKQNRSSHFSYKYIQSTWVFARQKKKKISGPMPQISSLITVFK
uniref:Uncharacterized protein n=1 Tax=Anguilla anguilla TaxID=7936 RepID=A0A0E9Q6I2_ANGAN